jgi:hypothetical protein
LLICCSLTNDWKRPKEVRAAIRRKKGGKEKVIVLDRKSWLISSREEILLNESSMTKESESLLSFFFLFLFLFLFLFVLFSLFFLFLYFAFIDTSYSFNVSIYFISS